MSAEIKELPQLNRILSTLINTIVSIISGGLLLATSLAGMVLMNGFSQNSIEVTVVILLLLCCPWGIAVAANILVYVWLKKTYANISIADLLWNLLVTFICLFGAPFLIFTLIK